MDKFVKPVNQITRASTSNPWTELWTPLKLKFILKKNYFLFNYMIIKINDCEIKHPLNAKMFF